MADFTFFQQLKEQKELEQASEELEKKLGLTESIFRIINSLSHQKDLKPKYKENYTKITETIQSVSADLESCHDPILHKPSKDVSKDVSEEAVTSPDSPAKPT